MGTDEKLEEMIGVGVNESREKKLTFNKVKHLITRYLRTRRNPLIGDIYMVDLTRIIRNILMKGTTMFTVVPHNRELLLLVAKGMWSGGAFSPGDTNLKDISHLATQHYDLSFSCTDEKVMIVPNHRFRTDY